MMPVKDYLAVAALLSAMAVSWKLCMSTRSGSKPASADLRSKPAKPRDSARLIDRVDQLERKLDQLTRMLTRGGFVDPDA